MNVNWWSPVFLLAPDLLSVAGMWSLKKMLTLATWKTGRHAALRWCAWSTDAFLWPPSTSAPAWAVKQAPFARGMGWVSRLALATPHFLRYRSWWDPVISFGVDSVVVHVSGWHMNTNFSKATWIFLLYNRESPAIRKLAIFLIRVFSLPFLC